MIDLQEDGLRQVIQEREKGSNGKRGTGKGVRSRTGHGRQVIQGKTSIDELLRVVK